MFLVKLMGMLLVILCTTMTGMSMASGLSRRVSMIEDAIALLSYFHDRLLYLQPTVGDLLRSAALQNRFEAVPYLSGCRLAQEQGTSFPESWQRSVLAAEKELGQKETALLVEIGDILGAADLDSQLSSLEYIRKQMEQRLRSARQDREKYAKLYGTLGVLAGMGLVVILA